MYMYCCYKCKLIIGKNVESGNYVCSKCGETITSLGVSKETWDIISPDNKKEIIAKNRNNNKPTVQKSVKVQEDEHASDIDNGNVNDAVEAKTKESSSKHSFFDDNITPERKDNNSTFNGETKICPECRKQVDIHLNKCPNCGYPFDEKNNKEITVMEKNTRSRKKLIIAGVIAVVILVSLIFVIRNVMVPNVKFDNFPYNIEYTAEIFGKDCSVVDETIIWDKKVRLYGVLIDRINCYDNGCYTLFFKGNKRKKIENKIKKYGTSTGKDNVYTMNSGNIMISYANNTISETESPWYGYFVVSVRINN